ncbi:recombinase family protein [Brevundimonas diminuta]|uniref:recombinase family protein n=1 Tax=Brevundimonas diminuta TaxID=293 RepID=UPI0022AE8C77|nr:recombinase family protein [Brevundimonas diminuta]MCZ4108542.1 recombinase family protein [Brevundimonas diminuta]
MNVIAYARFSSAAQAEGTSLDRQFDFAEAHAARNGWTISERLIDEGRSAFKAKHKSETAALGQFLRNLDQGRYGQGDILLVEALDRLSREEPLDALANLTRITSAGVRVEIIDAKLSLVRGQYEANIGSLVQLLVGAAQAHGESKRKSELLTKTWREKRKEGVVRTHHPHWMDKTKTLLPDRVKTVRMIFDLADRGFGRLKIAKELNAAGHKTWGGTSEKGKPKSGDWSAQQVSQILKNRAVLGEAQAFSGDEAVGPVDPDYYPRIIETEQFERVNSIPTRKFSGKGAGRQSLSGNIFRGWFNCSCGRPMVIDPKPGRRYVRCSGSLTKACPDAVDGLQKGRTYDVLEYSVLSAIREMKLVDRSNDLKAELQASLAEAERALEIAKANRTKLLDLYLTDDLDSVALKQRLADEEARVVEHSAEVERLKAELMKSTRTITDHQSEIVSLYDQFATVDDEDRPELRQRINQTLLRIIRNGRFVRHLDRFIITTNDHTTYFFDYALRPDAEKGRRGMRKASDFYWKATRLTIEDAMAATAGQIANDDLDLYSDEAVDAAVEVLGRASS